ncbi:type II CAAX prenyl endopeptidase Rce1 family protein [Streptomyces toxytricini]|uniref:Type II CAAX prenyl endopeptidase Rce1 family protein n=1 Tax=Streptomyces toxytricini TaxID=67369 RepID=A0ABW8EES1_STRT5
MSEISEPGPAADAARERPEGRDPWAPPGSAGDPWAPPGQAAGPQHAHPGGPQPYSGAPPLGGGQPYHGAAQGGPYAHPAAAWGWPVQPEPPRRVAAPAGTRYHEQSRNGRQRVWHRLGEFALVTGLFMVAMVLLVGIGMAVGQALGFDPAPEDGSDRLLADPLADQALALTGLAIGIPAVLLAVLWCGRRPPGTVVSVVGRMRWRWLGLCAAVAFPVMAAQMGVLVLWEWLEAGDEVFEGDVPGMTRLLVGLALFAALVPFQAAAEEFVFRGWLVQFFGGFLRSPWPGLCVASVLFALAHGFGGWSGFFLLLYSALWWGWLVLRTGGLEAVIAMHTANNVLSFGLALALGQLADSGTAADAPWQALVVELVSAPVFCLVVDRMARARGIASRRPADPAGAPPEVPPEPQPSGLPGPGTGTGTGLPA